MIALKNAVLLILFLIAFLSSQSVFALEITYSSINPFSGEQLLASALMLRGEIRSGDYNYLLDVLKKDDITFLINRILVLSTPGGVTPDVNSGRQTFFHAATCLIICLA
jgi:membrane-bound ClpP family serine protease